MKKILVPMDFSVPSSSGYYYAHDLAAAIDAELIVMHVYLPSSDTSIFDDYRNLTKEDILKRKGDIIEHMKSATQQPMGPKGDNVNVSYVVDYGEKNEIAYYAKLHKADLIVMGTRGANSTTSKVLGSNTVSVIQGSDCPVLAIPEGATFKKGMRIAYATTLSNQDIDSLKKLASIAAVTKSALHCIHVNLFKGAAHSDEEKTFVEALNKEIKEVPVTFTAWSATNVEDGLEIFCRVNSIDMLSVLHQDKSTWHKFLGKKSITRTLALQNKLPLLAFHD